MFTCPLGSSITLVLVAHQTCKHLPVTHVPPVSKGFVISSCQNRDNLAAQVTDKDKLA